MKPLADFELLSPDAVLTACEKALSPVALEPAVNPYNSYVNRVFAVKSEEGERYIAKFYRPGRWTREAIEEEHAFLADCAHAELPVVAPLSLKNGATIAEHDGFLFSVYPFRSGRTFDINSDDDYKRLGALIGRLHTVSKIHTAQHRLTLHPVDMTLQVCTRLAASPSMHPEFAVEFLDLCTDVLQSRVEAFSSAENIRIHGDCHRGNILDRMDEGLLLIDFDDMMTGPAVQDLWLLLPDHINLCPRETDLLLTGYTQFSDFDSRTLDLVETLRFMRIVYYLGWCESQKNDSLFQEKNPDWGTRAFWIREMEDLRYQADRV
ncbi:MAG TPA: serine/threonine protein kinase [Treponema sp.]|nr:serine/threonine protein kinase [Treponema sp.]